MKTLLKTSLASLLLFVSLITFANSSPNFILQPSYGKSFVFKLESNHTADYQIKLKDKKGIVLLKDQIIGKDSQGKIYNLTSLPAGTYTLVVEGNGKVQIQPLVVKTNKVKIDTSLQEVIYKPTFDSKDDHVDMTLLQLNDSPINITIANPNGNLIWEEKINENGSIKKRFDVALLKKGNYRFTVQIDEYYFHEQIQIK